MIDQRSQRIQKKDKVFNNLKEHDEGVGDGKTDAEDKYEIVGDEDLGKCDQLRCKHFLRVSLSP